MLKAVIFDFDGVIVDSEGIHLHSFNRVLDRYGAEVGKEDYYEKYLGLSDCDLYKRLIEEGILPCEHGEIEELIREKNAIFEEIARGEAKIIPGVREFLERIRAERIRMAVCSGSLMSEIALILEKCGLKEYFETIVSADEVNQSKPSPEGFIKVLDRLNAAGSQDVGASECVVVEDSQWGLDAASAAGMHTVAVTNSYGADELASADIITANLAELKVARLRELCGG